VNRRIGQLVLIGLWLVSGCRPSASAESPLASPLISPFALPTPSSISPTPISIGAVVHVVQPGDTIQSLALQYHVPVEQIYYLNDLADNELIRTGQQLIISDTNRIYTPPPTVTPRPTFTPTPLPTIIPPIQSVTADHLPQISHDLLFINNGRLTLWDHLTGRLEVLVGPETSSVLSPIQPVALMAGPGAPAGSVNGFSASNDGTKIALYRVITFTTYEIAFFDLGTRQLTPVYQGGSQGSNLLGMSISPDGQWIAYIPQDSSSSQDHRKPRGLAAPALYPSAGGGVRSGTVYAVRTDGSGKRLSVGVCGDPATQDYSRGCAGLIWSPDSRSIAWGDGRGLWLAQLGQSAKQLTTNSLPMPNEIGKSINDLLAWSSSGRYMLIAAASYGGSGIVVLDLETGNSTGLPNSEVSWISNDHLFVLRPGQLFGGDDPSAEIWHVDPISSTLSVRDRSWIIRISPESILAAPTQLEDGQLAFAVLNASNNNYVDRGLYVANENDLVSHKINGLPPVKVLDASGGSPPYFDVNIFWSPDGTGALAYDRLSGQLLYVPADGGDLYDLRSIMNDACCFVWIK
jgi:LysM domain